MLKAPIPINEEHRLEALNRYNILDTMQEEQLDEITKTAALICGCKISLISLIDKDRQWFKSKYGLEANETPRDVSYCGHAIMSSELFIIEDAELDNRFCDNPLFLGEPNVRFYAGAPLVTECGHRIGTLCVIDSEAKTLDEKQKLFLQLLSRQIINIFEMRKIIQEKRDSEFLLNETQKNAHIGGWDLDVRSLKTKWTDETYRIHEVEIGTPTNTQEGINFFAEHEREKISDYVKNAIEKGIPFESTFEFVTAKGNKKWVHSKGVPDKDDKGNVIRVLGTFQDITQEKLKEMELISSKEYLDLALEGAGLGIWDWYLTDNSVKFDKRWAEMLGLSIDEISMELSTWSSRVHPDDLDKCYADIKQYMDGKTKYYENVHRMKHKNGNWVYILDRGRFSKWNKDGEPIRFTGTHLDITQSKEKERELSLVLEGNNLGIWKYNLKEDFFYWDKSMYQLYEVEEGCFNGTYEGWISFFHSDCSVRVQKEFKDALAGTKSFDTTFSIVTQKNNIKFIKAHAILETDESGNAITIVGVNTDITKEQNSMHELNKQIKIAQHHAKLASIGELAAGVGHEINNPLAIVKGYLFEIEKKIERKSIQTEDLKSYVDKISIATDRISRIVQGLRTFSRSDSSDVTEFSPIHAVEESFNLINEIYRKDGIDVRFTNDVVENFYVLGNRGKFQQVLMNLISNAKDATAKKDFRTIDLNISKRGEKLIIEVKDNGWGIPDLLKDKVFDPFFTTKDVNKGIGIGLSLVNSFIKEMDGNIHFASKENEGTVFIIEVPVHNFSQTQTQTQTQTQDEEKTRGCAHILVVDDEEGVRELLTDIILNEGLQVTAVENGKEAYDLYLSQPDSFDLIISDMKMPVMDGPTLLKNLRALKNVKQPKFIFITGGININFEDKGNELNRLIDGYLYKPFSEEELFKLINKCLPHKLEKKFE